MRITLPRVRNTRLIGAILSTTFLASVLLVSVPTPATAAPQNTEDADVSTVQPQDDVAQDQTVRHDETAEPANTLEALPPAVSATATELSYGQAAKVILRATNAPANTGTSVIVSTSGSVVATVPLGAAGTASVTLATKSLVVGEHSLSLSLVDSATTATVFATATAQLRVKPATTRVSARWMDNDGSISGRVTGQFGTVPSGTVTFHYGGKEVGSAQLAKDGSFKGLFRPTGDSPSSDLTVTYEADPNHSRSSGKAAVTVVCFGPCQQPEGFQAFADVSLQHKFHTEIAWMYCQGYSKGWAQAPGLPLYRPSERLTRSAMAAFVYRMEAPKNYRAPSESPFSDVNPGDPFYKEITWMWKQGLSKGYAEAGKPSFRPNNGLSREAMAAFMYRLEAPKNFSAPKKSPFADVSPGAKFYKEITWLYSAKLSTGTKTAAGREYLPHDTLSREAMAAFTYRLFENLRS